MRDSAATTIKSFHIKRDGNKDAAHTQVQYTGVSLSSAFMAGSPAVSCQNEGILLVACLPDPPGSGLHLLHVRRNGVRLVQDTQQAER